MVGQKCAMAVITLSAMLSSGCGEDLTNVPTALPVTGTVTLDGSPLPGANIIFSDGKQFSAMGVTDGTGKYTVKTRFNSVITLEGAPPREYTVTISKTIPPDGMSEELYKIRKKENRERRESGLKPKREDRINPRIQIIHPYYSRADVTRLKAIVKTGQQNDFVFPLESNPSTR